MTKSLTTCSTNSHWATLSLGNSKFCKAHIFILAQHQFDEKNHLSNRMKKSGNIDWEMLVWLQFCEDEGQEHNSFKFTTFLRQRRLRRQVRLKTSIDCVIAFLSLPLLLETAGDWQKREVSTKYVNFFNILKVVQILNFNQKNLGGQNCKYCMASPLPRPRTENAALDRVKSIDTKSGTRPMQGTKSLILVLPNHLFQTHRWQMS